MLYIKNLTKTYGEKKAVDDVIAAVKEGKTTPPKHFTEDICCERGIRNHP